MADAGNPFRKLLARMFSRTALADARRLNEADRAARAAGLVRGSKPAPSVPIAKRPSSPIAPPVAPPLAAAPAKPSPAKPKASSDYERGVAGGKAQFRARGRAIMASPAAATNVPMAIHLMLETGAPVAEAVLLLDGAASGARTIASTGLDAAMAARNDPNPGADGGRSPGDMTFGERVQHAKAKIGKR